MGPWYIQICCYFDNTPNTQYCTKMQSRTTKPHCYQTCDVSASEVHKWTEKPHRIIYPKQIE